jgi:class 3 adenylate cyclase
MHNTRRPDSKNVLDYSDHDTAHSAYDDSFGRITPLAELYEECTVMLADLAGFTAWSSSREPSHVFELLETIFCSFDVIARKKRVFKVGTVVRISIIATVLATILSQRLFLLFRAIATLPFVVFSKLDPTMP